jgi:hypothetical protein
MCVWCRSRWCTLATTCGRDRGEGANSTGVAVAKLTVAESIHRDYQQNSSTNIRLPEDAAHLFSELCQVPYLVVSQQGDRLVATSYGGCVLGRYIWEVAMVFRQDDFCVALAAGAVPIQLQPMVVRGLGDVHMYYVLNPAAVAQVQPPMAGPMQAAQRPQQVVRPAPAAAAVTRQVGQLEAIVRHARPFPLPPPLMRLGDAGAGAVRGWALHHAGGMCFVLHWFCYTPVPKTLFQL